MRPVAIEAEVQARQKIMKQRMRTWLPFGKCKTEPDLNFTPPYSDDLPEQEERAKAVCNTCPVRLVCLDHALKFPECAGIWGGLNEQERKALKQNG